ncbi:MAG: T9SS type A sorting domain-containing protein [Bacteroidetes bacterium]|nr:T9SS type A sorting domain-containing protein [Bacteroidota bacterium]
MVLNTANLAKGIYFIETQTEKEKTVRKVVKQ